MSTDFDAAFATLTGNSPFPWQRAFYERLLLGDIPESCDIPTGLGKTTVIALWLLARSAGAILPRRLVYVVNRRTVVDQTTEEVERLGANLEAAGIHESLAISTLRGQMADNRAWSADPSQPAVICGTVDMIGSRLLFSGYRIGFRSRPLHAAFLGQDALLVHDEAHLEPAFQQLVESIQREQKFCGDPWPLRVTALTATARSGGTSFGLTPKDAEHPIVAKRLHAVKKLSMHQHGDKDLAESIVTRALTYLDSNSAVLVFLRTVEGVARTALLLRNAGAKVQQLTGTMRGFERDRLVSDDPIFRRFLPSKRIVEGVRESVYLICTSAGEVGVNLSADHLISDLSTFDSMAQRFGRVNRFGVRPDSEIHVFHPSLESLGADTNKDAEPRRRTVALLRTLEGDASPSALGRLDGDARRAAFAPVPQILPATDILFDAWAMTTIRDTLPGRPPILPYLHGVAQWEPPRTLVAWRDDVDLVSGVLLDQNSARDLLDDYPLKPQEMLNDLTSRVLDTLEDIAKKHPEPERMPVWVVSNDGNVDAHQTLASLVGDDRKTNEGRLAGATLLLPPKHCRPVSGFFSSDGIAPECRDRADVADAWVGPNGVPYRVRVFDSDQAPTGMRLVRSITLADNETDEDGDVEASVREKVRRWSWYELPRGADDDGSRSSTKPVLLEVHATDVEREAKRIVDPLRLEPGLKRAVVAAAKLHDLGKNRLVWQRSIGNADRTRILAKSGRAMVPLDITAYRHELGSIVDASRLGLLASLDPHERELALHLVAAHHGRARPHFPPDELFDPEAQSVAMDKLGIEIVTRFAALQRRFGRWGLAYLESLVRAADYAASAQPSEFLELPR